MCSMHLGTNAISKLSGSRTMDNCFGVILYGINETVLPLVSLLYVDIYLGPKLHDLLL